MLQAQSGADGRYYIEFREHRSDSAGVIRQAGGRPVHEFPEHKVIAAFETTRTMPSIDDARRFSPVHNRCGTNFASLFVIVAGFVYAPVPRTPLLLRSSFSPRAIRSSASRATAGITLRKHISWVLQRSAE